jgi:hypothetical protein
MFATDKYYVNQYAPVDRSNLDNSYAGYGLVVQGLATNIEDISVRGAAFLPPNTYTDQITQLVDNCPVTNTEGTGSLNPYIIFGDARFVSERFKSYNPSLYLDENNNLVTVGPKTDGYDVITMNTCSSRYCSLGIPGPMSSPDNTFYGLGEWNGPVGQEWPSKLIINVRVYHQLGLLEELVR